MQCKSDFIFVYGTLLCGTGSLMHQWLAQRADFVDDGFFQGRLYRIGTYPGVRTSQRAKDWVRGEIYQLHDAPETLAQLDAYENYDPARPRTSEYIRVLRPIRCRSGGTLSSWLYLHQQVTARYPRIPSGDFLRVKRLGEGIRAMEDSMRGRWSLGGHSEKLR
jgi:gamma-glutamylcyclotransferase (GGCT)/AIG2-like uncharacterized protein YtfP